MAFILVAEPHGDEARRAFDALDDALGTDEFTEADANEVLKLHGFSNNMFTVLVTAGSISEG
jgi:hypothetical protein